MSRRFFSISSERNSKLSMDKKKKKIKVAVVLVKIKKKRMKQVAVFLLWVMFLFPMKLSWVVTEEDRHARKDLSLPQVAPTNAPFQRPFVSFSSSSLSAVLSLFLLISLVVSFCLSFCSAWCFGGLRGFRFPSPPLRPSSCAAHTSQSFRLSLCKERKVSSDT